MATTAEYVRNVYVAEEDDNASLIASFTDTREANKCVKKLTEAFPQNEYFMLKEKMDRDIDEIIYELSLLSSEESEDNEE